MNTTLAFYLDRNGKDTKITILKAFLFYVTKMT